MINLNLFIFSALLFYVLSPGILIIIPQNSSKLIVAFVHAVVYATIWYFIYNYIWNMTESFETLTEKRDKKIKTGDQVYKAYLDYLDFKK
jgi:hypothetical protein